jgi:secondary thiamine-phosphate synthase enzyme
MIEITVRTTAREEMQDITARVQHAVSESRLPNGYVICFVPHTTAGITINEHADPAVCRDILYKLHKEIPQVDGYHHAEGNADAHLKASLMGSSVQILFANRRLILGTWQGIFFCEFDGPRSRTLLVKVVGGD